MVRAECPDGDVWTYAYDPFGRRISKACKHTKVTFIWDGDVIAREITETRERVDVVDWFFEPGSFRPMARLEAGDLTHVINDHLGTPKEVVGRDGSLRWSADHDTWGTLRTNRGTAASQIETGDYWIEPTSIEGNTAKAYAPNPDALYCPIRFQGQWEDGETGLYYNRFRYYDSFSCFYFSRDPIGIRGDTSTHRYSVAPHVLTDPPGLIPCRCCGWGSFAGEIGNSLFTPDDPASLGLNVGDTIPFNDGIPDFGQYTLPIGSLPGAFDVPGLPGVATTDRALAIKHIATTNNWTQARAERELLRLGGGIDKLRIHHVCGDTMQLVPHKLHRLPHYGGAAELRDNC